MKEGGITAADIKELRDRLQAGDLLTCEILVKIREDERLLVPVKVAVRVVEKYPHLVRVEADGKRPLPIRTMTYVQILTQSDTQEKERDPGKKGRKRKRRGKYRVR